MWEVIQMKRVTNFCTNHGLFHYPNQLKHFFMNSISDMPTIKYWQNLGSMTNKAKENMPKQCRIGDKGFTSLATIGDNLFTRNSKNLNHVHKDRNDLLSVIIISVTHVHGSETFFMTERKCMILGKDHIF